MLLNFFGLKQYFKVLKKRCFVLIVIATSNQITADSFQYNTYNNHGSIGLINIPTARFYESSSHGITIYDGEPPQKMTLTSNPYDWLEASVFYTNIQGRPYPGYEYQDYKDKGFNFKLRIKKEDSLPAIAIGINDVAGTGLFSSEYIVASMGVGNIDYHFGLGWGALSGSNTNLNNPLGYISNKFNDRPTEIADQGGQFSPSTYFSGEKISPFFGMAYAVNNKLVIKLEKDTTLIEGRIKYEIPKSSYTYGFDFSFNENFTFGIYNERGNYISAKFIYKNNPNNSRKPYKYKKQDFDSEDTKYTKLIRNLENNGIGVTRIIETTDSIGLQLTQFAHPNINIIEEIIASASYDAGINKEIKKDIRIADLKAVSEFNNSYIDESTLIYERKKNKAFFTKTNVAFRPFLASREEFFKGALMVENNSEYIIKDNFIFSSNLKYSLWDNFDDLTIPPYETYPAQVRSDVKDYLRNIDEGILIGRAQFDYFKSLSTNHHLMSTFGVLEDMYSGFGIEYLYYKNSTNYAAGFEIFNVKKRDYEWKFGTLNYENITGSVNFYYRNYDYIPFDFKASYGEYLAGDEGLSIELSRSFKNGTQFGIFASFTDVSSEQFGEGSFDKGIFFNIPIYGNLINYTWRPLTKDPGAKLNRRNTLYNLLVKFKPID